MAFEIGQRVVYRLAVARARERTLIRAVVRNVTTARVTIEYEVRGDKVRRVVAPKRLAAAE